VYVHNFTFNFVIYAFASVCVYNKLTYLVAVYYQRMLSSPERLYYSLSTTNSVELDTFHARDRLQRRGFNYAICIHWEIGKLDHLHREIANGLVMSELTLIAAYQLSWHFNYRAACNPDAV